MNDELVLLVEAFKRVYKLELITIKVKCENCENSWGIKIGDFDSPAHIHPRKFVCENCYNNIIKK